MLSSLHFKNRHNQIQSNSTVCLFHAQDPTPETPARLQPAGLQQQRSPKKHNSPEALQVPRHSRGRSLMVGAGWGSGGDMDGGLSDGGLGEGCNADVGGCPVGGATVGDGLWGSRGPSGKLMLPCNPRSPQKLSSSTKSKSWDSPSFGNELATQSPIKTIKKIATKTLMFTSNEQSGLFPFADWMLCYCAFDSKKWAESAR